MKPGTLLVPKRDYSHMHPDRACGLIVRRLSRFLVEILWCSQEIQRISIPQLHQYKVIA